MIFEICTVSTCYKMNIHVIYFVNSAMTLNIYNSVTMTYMWLAILCVIKLSTLPLHVSLVDCAIAFLKVTWDRNWPRLDRA